MVQDGRALRSYKNGRARIAGYLEDHAALGLAAIALYELTFDRRWLDRAREMSAACVQWFWSDEKGAFYDTASDHESLITRPRDVADNATPSGASLAVELLLRMAELFDDAEARKRATYVLETLGPAMARYPNAFGQMLGNADMAINGAVEVVIAGDPSTSEFQQFERALADEYVPSLVMAGGRDSSIALLAGRAGPEATAYICRNYACAEPATSLDQFRFQLANITGARP
jgi:uncharacterized protein